MEDDARGQEATTMEATQPRLATLGHSESRIGNVLLLLTMTFNLSPFWSIILVSKFILLSLLSLFFVAEAVFWRLS